MLPVAYFLMGHLSCLGLLIAWALSPGFQKVRSWSEKRGEQFAYEKGWRAAMTHLPNCPRCISGDMCRPGGEP